MKRILLTLFLVAAGCSSPPKPADIEASCRRWALKYASLGAHRDTAAYQEDLLSTCMAMKRTPYTPQYPPPR